MLQAFMSSLGKKEREKEKMKSKESKGRKQERRAKGWGWGQWESPCSDPDLSNGAGVSGESLQRPRLEPEPRRRGMKRAKEQNLERVDSSAVAVRLWTVKQDRLQLSLSQQYGAVRQAQYDRPVGGEKTAEWQLV